MSAETISCKGLVKRYHGIAALDDVSLDVLKGETVALIGPSGSGKSTLLRCINHLETLDDGIVIVDGQPVGWQLSNGELAPLSDAEISNQRMLIGMVFQSFNLFAHMTALQNVMEGPVHVKGLDRRPARRLAVELLSRVGLSAKLNSYPHELSGGQQQRVAIARALAMEPSVILMDEPTSALDPELVGEVLEVIRKVAQSGATLVIATHEIGFAGEVADRVVFMDHGKIVETGSARDVLQKPKNDRTRAFLSHVLNRHGGNGQTTSELELRRTQ